MTLRKFSYWFFGSIAVLIVLLIALDFLIDAPLRNYMEREVNHRLKGYKVQIGALNFHVFGFSLDLERIVVIQQANPTPPLAEIKKLTASIQWRSLLRGRIVSDYRIERPVVYLNFAAAQEEINHSQKKSDAEEKGKPAPPDRGWQKAIQTIYPVKINHLEMVDGDLTYVDNIPLKQIHFRKIHFVAENILNVESAPHVYPSPVHLEGAIFDRGQIRLNGKADFLAVPYIGIQTGFNVDQLDLRDLEPLIRRLPLIVHQGTLSGAGEVEYSPQTQTVHIEKILLDQAHIDYVYQPGPAASKSGDKAAETAKEASTTESAPSTLITVDELDIARSNLGFINKGAKPNYRVYINQTELQLTHLSNHLTEGKTEAKLKGKFMGSGNLGANAVFRPQKKGPNLNLAVSIEETDLKTMNDLLRAYGNFDVAAGAFSFFMELAVREGNVTGYVKPLFQKIKVYDRRQDKEKSAFHKLYERLVGGVSKLLENQPRDEVATRADLSGRIENPKSSTWDTIIRIIENAFFKAILPGFEKEVSQSKQ
ncbi:MAG: DUF748 domain-containing protein [Nitrospirae bacterium]|nr:DUF748 domain-containing protein [Candidatus Manganitrophaceae bacterium]